MIESVLLACSNEADASAIMDTLKDQYCVEVFSTGTALLSYLAKYPNQDMVTILDDSISDIEIDELALKIKRASPMVFLIGIMGKEDTKRIVRTVKAGISDIIAKPYSESEVLLITRQAFDHINLISHLQRQVSLVTEEGLKRRIDSFRYFVESRRLQNQFVLPSEIHLFFPDSETDLIPIETLIQLIESNSLKSTSNSIKYRPKCLIIEDESVLNGILVKIMSREFDVTSVETAEDGIQEIETGAKFDVALLDIGLPGTSGDEIVKDLKDVCPDMQIIMVTGFTEHQLIVKCLVAGASDYITKPFDHQTLMEKVSKHVQNQLTMNWIKRHLEVKQ
ncbi:response regulator [bacterium]|nr:response regulator [bacterium]